MYIGEANRCLDVFCPKGTEIRTNPIECTRSEIHIYVWCVKISQLLEKFNKIGPARPEFTPSEMTAKNV